MGQGRHSAAPGASWKVPGGHGEQPVAKGTVPLIRTFWGTQRHPGDKPKNDIQTTVVINVLMMNACKMCR